MFETPGGTALRGYNGTAWGTIASVDDSKTMQRVDVRGLNGEFFHDVERPQTFGFTSVPLPPDGAKAAEVVVGFRAGNRAHPYIHATDDRRYRPKNLKPGESKHHDDQGQYSHLARNGHVAVAKNHSVTAGDQPDTGDHEVNNQLKGLDARTAQLEHNLHGLFDVTSRLNMIAMSVIPALKQLAPILNQDPSGLPMMANAIAGKEQAYLQQQIQQALDKFNAPTITGVGSVIFGGLEALISAATAQIASQISANPVVATVDNLVAELAALQSSGSSSVVAAMAPVIQGLIDSATGGNPAVGQVANLRNTLASLLSAAGPGLNFLVPQQRMVQGLSRSLKLSP